MSTAERCVFCGTPIHDQRYAESLTKPDGKGGQIHGMAHACCLAEILNAAASHRNLA